MPTGHLNPQRIVSLVASFALLFQNSEANSFCTMSLSTIATIRLSSRISLVIARGSVLDFASTNDAAIVNAANMGCLGGGGVDGAISNAGGNALYKARLALPIVHGKYVRCPEGDAKITGPGEFGSIMTNHVIHAVGPDYNDFYREDYGEADALLKSAYRRTLEVAAAANLTDVAFSLLAAGVFRGERSLKQVLRLGIRSIISWSKAQSDASSVQSIVMCAFLEKEANTLLAIADDLNLEIVYEEVVDEMEVDAMEEDAVEEKGEMTKELERTKETMKKERKEANEEAKQGIKQDTKEEANEAANERAPQDTILKTKEDENKKQKREERTQEQTD